MDITAALLNLAKLVSDHGDDTNHKAIRIVTDNLNYFYSYFGPQHFGPQTNKKEKKSNRAPSPS